MLQADFQYWNGPADFPAPPLEPGKMREGLLISSFSEGLVPNAAAHNALSRGLWRCLLTEEQTTAEMEVESSVRFSPCNGPNTESLFRLEQSDQVWKQFQECTTGGSGDDTCWRDAIRQRGKLRRLDEPTILRFVYIPTAMYALRPGSNNTPGKQRQRARADAKQRRDEIFALLHNILNVQDGNGNDNPVAIAAVTLDFDDGSIKHPAVTNPSLTGKIDFPTDGKSSLQEWKPHFVYIQGGNTFWLYHCLEKGRWKDDLVQLLKSETTFYCGASAGAILAGASMETACWKEWDDPSVVPNRGTYDAWNGVAGLNLVPGDPAAFFPHYDDQQWSRLVQDRRSDLLARTGVDVICLREQEVYYVNGSVSLLL